MTLLRPSRMVDMVLPHGWQGSTLDVRQSLTRTLEAGLDRVRDAPTIPAAVRASWDLDRELDSRAGASGVDRLVGTLRRATRDEHDGVLAIAAVHAMARLPGSAADAELRAIVVDDVPGLATHALWAMRGRPSWDLVTTLAQRIARGGLEGTHAQGLLARWGAETRFAAASLDALVEQARRTGSPGARRRIVETMGLIPGRRARDLLVRHALDEGEDLSVRRTAVAAFAERTTERLPSRLVALATRADTLGDAVRRGPGTAQPHPSRAASGPPAGRDPCGAGPSRSRARC